MKIKMVASTTSVFFSLCELLEFAVGKKDTSDRLICVTLDIKDKGRKKDDSTFFSDVYAEGMYQYDSVWIIFKVEFVLETTFGKNAFSEDSGPKLTVWSGHDTGIVGIAWLKSGPQISFESEDNKVRFTEAIEQIKRRHQDYMNEMP